MKFIRLALILVLVFISIYSQGQKINNNRFKIYDTKQKKEITIAEIVNAMSDVDVLFFGELHNDSTAHVLQDTLLKALIHSYKNIALSLEALSNDDQIIMNECLKDYISEEEFEKLAGVWMPYYHSYKPLIQIAKKYHLPVIAANAPNRYITLVGERGMAVLDGLDDVAKSYLPPLPYYVPEGKYREKYINTMKRSIYVTDSLYQSFCLYDASMANNIYKFSQSHFGYKILQIIGNFHVDEKMGTITQLKRLGNISFLTISCFYDESFTNPDWNKYISLADFIIVTNPDVKRTF